LRAEFEAAGFTLSEHEPDLVVLGFDKTLTYEKLVRLCDHVRAGVPFWATHPDINCPIPGGYVPDTGSFIALIEASTGRRPDRIIGKPHPYLVEVVMRAASVGPEATAYVGDRLYTDMEMARRAGVTGILVLSGETKRDDVDKSSLKPDMVVQDLVELAALL